MFSYQNARLKKTFTGWTSTTFPSCSVMPAGWFIHALAATTAAVPPIPDSTTGRPVQKCVHGAIRFQP